MLVQNSKKKEMLKLIKSEKKRETNTFYKLIYFILIRFSRIKKNLDTRKYTTDHLSSPINFLLERTISPFSRHYCVPFATRGADTYISLPPPPSSTRFISFETK